MELLEKDLTEKVIGLCFEVANELGDGFLESVYQKALVFVLKEKGLKAEEQVPLKVTYRGFRVGDFVADVLVEDRLILELKSVKSQSGEHEAQLMNSGVSAFPAACSGLASEYDNYVSTLRIEIPAACCGELQLSKGNRH